VKNRGRIKRDKRTVCQVCFVVLASLTPQNKPHAKNGYAIFSFAHPPPNKGKSKQKDKFKNILYIFAALAPVPHLRQSANTLGASGGQRGGKWLTNQNVSSKKQADKKYKQNFFTN